MDLELLVVAFRGMASGVALVFLGVLWINAAPRVIRVAFTLTLVASLCRSWSSLPPGVDMPGELTFALKYVGATAMVFFTWAFSTLFLDDRRFFWIWIGSACLVTLGLWIVYLDPRISMMIRVYAALHTIVFMIAIVLSQKDDLIEKRRQARVWVAICIITHVLVVATVSTPMFTASSVTRPLIDSLMQLFSYTVFTLWAVTRTEQTWVIEQSQRRQAPEPPNDIRPLQVALIRQIEIAMQNEIWRKEGLSVGDLAQEVGAPEHQVRVTINQVLGHRNFSSFINKARIEAAKQHLSSPENVKTSVQEIAYAVGFSSIAPFNRAFRDATGQSPSDFRKTALRSAFSAS